MMSKKTKSILYYILPITLLLISLYCIFNNYLWSDETFSMVITQKSYSDMIYNLSLDMHPPVYFSILKFGSELFKPIFNGNIIYSAKFITFLPIILLVVTGYTLVRKLYGDLVSFLFNIFIISMPEMLVFAVEIRMYSYALLFVTLSFLYLIKILRTNKINDWIIFTILTIFSTYTHYFSTFASIFIYLIFMIYILFVNKKYIKRFILSSVIVIISFLPWLYLQIIKLFSGGMIDDFWITKPTIMDVIDYIKFPFSVMKYNYISYVLIITTIFVVFILIYKLFKDKVSNYKYEALYALSIIILVTLTGLVISLIIKPIFVKRYMVPSLGLFWLAIAITIGKYIEKDDIKKTLLTIYILSGLVVVLERIEYEHFYTKEINKMYNTTNKINFKDKIIITDKQKIQHTFAYYFPKTKIYLVGQNILSLLYDNTFDTNYVINIEDLNQIDYKNNQDIIFAISDTTLLEKNNINISNLE